MSDPLVSIIIPVFNRKELIRYCLDSVCNQTYTNWECIVVDDGSTDSTCDVLKKYTALDKRFHFYKRKRTPKGAPTCRNIGLDYAKGDFVIYLDSDDLMAPDCLSERVAIFQENPSYDFHVFTTILFFDEAQKQCFNWNIETDEDDLARFFRMDALWQTSGPIYKRSVLLKFGGFNANLKFWQDFDLHLRLLVSGCSYMKHFYLPPDIYIRAGRKDTISRSTPFTSNKQILQERIDFYFKLYPLVQQAKIKMTHERLISLHSTVYFFCTQFYLKHGIYSLFKANWKRLNKQKSSKTVFYWHGIILLFLMKLSNKFSFIRQLAEVYGKMAGKHAPDISILSRNKIEKVRYVG